MANGEVSGRHNKGKLSFRALITAIILLFIIPILGVLGPFSIVTNYKSATDAVSELLPTTATITARAVENELNMYTELLNEISSGIPSDITLSEGESDKEERLAFLNTKKSEYGFTACH